MFLIEYNKITAAHGGEMLSGGKIWLRNVQFVEKNQCREIMSATPTTKRVVAGCLILKEFEWPLKAVMPDMSWSAHAASVPEQWLNRPKEFQPAHKGSMLL